VVKLSAIGDVAQCLFALPALRAAFPGARLGWAVSRGPHELLAGHPCLDHLHLFERHRWGGRTGAWHHPRELWAFVRELRDVEYELAIDLQGLARSAVITRLSGARRRLGFARSRELARLAYTDRLDCGLAPRHAVERYRMLLAHAGATTVPDAPTGLAPDSPAAAATAAEVLAPVTAARWRVALLPGARWPTKQWGAPAFGDLAARLLAEGCGVVVLGSAADRELAATICAVAPAVLDLTGALSLPELAAVLRRVDLLVTCDTGPMHIAAEARTPCLALFGPTDPGRTGPRGTGHRILTAPVPCSPCLSRVCRRGDVACLRHLPSAHVAGEALAMLGAVAPGGQPG
jgi:lipopolysaccharide heptosyltransferase I